MIRHAAAAALVLCLCPAWLFGQTTELVVKGASANIHKAPTTASPVIDTAPRGAVLDVTRDLGSWLKIAWPDAPDGVGYVHVSLVTTARSSLTRRNETAGSALIARPAPGGATGTPSAYRQAIEAVAQHGTLTNAGTVESDANAETAGTYIRPTAHVVGFGGRMTGSTIGYGVSARAWPGRRLGLQIDLSRYSLTNPAMPARQTSIQFAPSVLYRLDDHVTDYVWVRPYFGGGASLHRQSLGEGLSDTTFGYQAFGGGEFTFAGVPRFAISADAGYRWSRSPFAGFDLGGPTFSLAGHWYFR
jgi:hypothetical protein